MSKKARKREEDRAPELKLNCPYIDLCRPPLTGVALKRFRHKFKQAPMRRCGWEATRLSWCVKYRELAGVEKDCEDDIEEAPALAATGSPPQLALAL
jgi:hypothetical protein